LLGSLALALLLGCDGKTDPAEQGAAGAGGTSAGRGGSSSGGGGAGGKAGSSGRAGSGATGGTGTAGGGQAGSTSAGGTGGTAAGAGGSAGDAEGGEAGAPNDDTIRWDAGGFISAGSNAAGIQGSWFFETDCTGATLAGLPCTVPNPALVGPDMLAGWSTNTTRVCTKGIVPQVVNDPMTGMPAYVIQWGARLGFELNAAGSGARQPFDAEEQGISGFALDIVTQSTPPQPADVRINVVTTGTVDDPHFVQALLPAATLNVRLSDALQGTWVTAPVVLDQSELTAITFQVYTNVVAPKPFDFCISNVRVLR
jgi:hypothetical protein